MSDVVDEPEHGTPKRYNHGTRTTPPCREDCCRQAANAARRQLRKRHAYGRVDLVDPSAARAHVEALHAGGLGYHRIAEIAGVSPQVVTRLLGRVKGRGPSQRIRAQAAAALLAVRPGLDDLPPTARVPAHATARYLQALVASGRPFTVIAAELDTAGSLLRDIAHGRQTRVWVATATAVRDLARRWIGQAPPRSTHVDRIRYSGAVTLAARHGWVRLPVWETLPTWHEADGPDPQPEDDGPGEPDSNLALAATAGRLRLASLSVTDAEYVVTALRDEGRTGEDIADLLRCTPADLAKVRERARARAARAARRSAA